jgi:hypothetical protein
MANHLDFRIINQRIGIVDTPGIESIHGINLYIYIDKYTESLLPIILIDLGNDNL